MCSVKGVEEASTNLGIWPGPSALMNARLKPVHEQPPVAVVGAEAEGVCQYTNV